MDHLDLSGSAVDLPSDLPSIGCSAAAPFSKNVSNRLSVPVQLNKASSTTARVRVVFYAVTKNVVWIGRWRCCRSCDLRFYLTVCGESVLISSGRLN